MDSKHFKKMGQLKFHNAQKGRQVVCVFPQLLYPPLSLEIVYQKMYLIYCSNMTLHTEQQVERLSQAPKFPRQQCAHLIYPTNFLFMTLVATFLNLESQFLVFQFSVYLKVTLFCP